MRLDAREGMTANKRTGGVRRILRPCSTPGCPELTPGGPCEQHRRARQHEHDERRGSSTERGYDADHRWLRFSASSATAGGVSIAVGSRRL
jgi:hypothetical protein